MIPRDQMTDRERAAYQQGWEVGARDGAAAAETREKLRRDKPVGVMTVGHALSIDGLRDEVADLRGTVWETWAALAFVAAIAVAGCLL